MSAVPSGWPQLPPPEAAEFLPAAVNYLLDRTPPEYRGYPVLRTNPVVLARLAVRHVAAQAEATVAAIAAARTELASLVGADVVEATMAVLEREQRRLTADLTGVRLVERALRGQRFTARL